MLTYADVCCAGKTLGCDGRCGSLAALDVCGVCNGAGNTCLGCDGKANSGAVEDECGVCGGAHFALLVQTCLLTGTKVQMLTPEELRR
jgi:hypothetical protein